MAAGKTRLSGNTLQRRSGCVWMAVPARMWAGQRVLETAATGGCRRMERRSERRGARAREG